MLLTHCYAYHGQVYGCQVEIEQELRGVRAEVARLSNNITKVSNLVRQVGHGLKQLGDLENYVQVGTGVICVCIWMGTPRAAAALTVHSGSVSVDGPRSKPLHAEHANTALAQLHVHHGTVACTHGVWHDLAMRVCACTCVRMHAGP